jgi:segregation and condensation protein B
MQDLKNIIESLLFVADEPLSLDKLRGVIETADSKEIRAALQDLANDYEIRAGGFRLQEVAGGWQIRSRPEYHEWIKRLLQPSPQRLSKAALETLAVIAYKQPIIRADIEHIRGVDCGGILRQLMERKLVRVLGRREIAGRPLIYATTKIFLEIFDLKDLNDLPSPKEIAELSGERNLAPESEPAETPPLPSFRDESADQSLFDAPIESMSDEAKSLSSEIGDPDGGTGSDPDSEDTSTKKNGVEDPAADEQSDL